MDLGSFSDTEEQESNNNILGREIRFSKKNPFLEEIERELKKQGSILNRSFGPVGQNYNPFDADDEELGWTNYQSTEQTSEQNQEDVGYMRQFLRGKLPLPESVTHFIIQICFVHSSWIISREISV